MMSRKMLVVLAGALVGVIVLFLLSERSATRTSPGGGFVDVLPGSFDPAAVQTVRAWLGSAPEEAVELEREGDGWVVASRWGWTAKEDLVKRLLEDLGGLRGEKRASLSNVSTSADVLADFQADDETGLHVTAAGAAGTELFHLVVGKTALRGGGFVRLAESQDIYMTQAGLRSSFGVWGEEPTAPDAKRWIELRVHQADRLDVDRIVVRDGSREMILEKEFAAKTPEADPADSTAATAVPEVDRSQWTWKSDAAGDFDKGKTDGILTSLCSLYAFDVADPDSLENYGLLNPERSVSISQQGGGTVEMFFGAAQADDDKKQYFRVGADGKPALIYTATVDRIFQDRGDLKPDA